MRAKIESACVGGVDANSEIQVERKGWDQVGPAWERWNLLLERNMAYLNDRLIKDALIRTGQRVLDLGCGTGYPALLAAQAVGNQGRVIGLDLARQMLMVAQRKAQTLGLENLSFLQGDIPFLPFRPDSFNAIVSRFCLMFLPDLPLSLQEVARALKPGGRLAAVVWSVPEKNPYLRIPMEAVRREAGLPPLQAGSPGHWRLAKPGDLLRMAREAGLQGVADEEIRGGFRLDSEEEYFTSIIEMVAPIRSVFDTLSAPQMEKAESEIKRAAQAYRSGGKIALPTAVRAVIARKPS